MGLQRSSDGCDGLAVVRCLTCDSRGVVYGFVLGFDFLPHKLARGWGDRGGRVVGGRGKPLVPKVSLGVIGAVLGPSIVLVE